MGRAPCCEKVGLRRGRWTAEEDHLLSDYIQAHGEGSWRSLPKNAGLLRCGKSCRLRWINYLRSDVKRGNISTEEEDLIIKLHASLGNRWSLIAGELAGRTDNEIKNYWNSHLSRRKLQIPSINQPKTSHHLPSMDNKQITDGGLPPPPPSPGAGEKEVEDNEGPSADENTDSTWDWDFEVENIDIEKQDAMIAWLLSEIS